MFKKGLYLSLCPVREGGVSRQERDLSENYVCTCLWVPFLRGDSQKNVKNEEGHD